MSDATKVREQIRDSGEGVTSGAAGPQTARRRLMLGAAAALPSVYTLTSGARTAEASNHSCLDRDRGDDPGRDRIGKLGDDDTDEDAPRFTMAQDDWLRKEVYNGVYEGQPAYCALEDQKACIDLTNPSHGALGSVWIVDGKRVTVGLKTTVTEVSYTPRAYGLVYVNEEGTIATVDPEPRQHLYPVREKCWTSIIGGRGSSLG